MESNSESTLPHSVLPCSIYLTQDLLAEILKRLPAKTLFRFLSVCKSWKTLISSTHFARVHYSHTSSAAMKPYLRRQKSLVSLHSSDLTFSANLGSEFEFDLVDVIYGVICFSHSLFDHTILFNPSIHKYVIIAPPSFLKFGFNCRCSLIGFGYSSSDNDFKVVRVWIRNFDEYGRSVLEPTYEVYSSRAGTWKKSTSYDLESCSIIDLYGEGRKGCFLDGTIYWTVHTKNKHSLLMFDCESEEFTTEELPKEIVSYIYMPYSNYPWRMKLMEYAGMLSLVTELHWPEYEYVYNVQLWVMKENDWKKVYRFKDRYSYDTFDDSLVKLDSYGPKEWNGTNEFSVYDGILSMHVYAESMFLMDCEKAKSYSKNENIRLSMSEIIY